MSTLNIEQLFKILVIDLKSIFHLDIEVFEVGSSQSHFSCNKVIGVNKFRINYSKDAGKAVINSVEELMQYVVIFGHELAHCINHHNAYHTRLTHENIAMESMADFQGARYATALYLWGKNLQEILRKNFDYTDGLRRNLIHFCKLMGRVFSILYNDFYKDNNSSLYPHPCNRVTMNINGICSYLYRSPQNLHNPGFYVIANYYITVSLNEDVQKDMITHKNVTHDKNHFLEVHRKIQGDNLQITEINNIKAQSIFGTAYHKTDEEHLKQKKEMKNEILDFIKNSDFKEVINPEVLDKELKIN